MRAPSHANLRQRLHRRFAGAGGKIIGLSKYDRIVEHFASRFQIQEELVKQIGNFIVEVTRPLGLAVRVSAVHMCKTHRGVRASHASRMVNTALYGAMQENPSLKAEFLQECASMERIAEPPQSSAKR
jgi:GTP cyclohydrolase IA